MTDISISIQHGLLEPKQHAIRTVVNLYSNVCLCYVSKEVYDALPQDLEQQMKIKVIRLLDEAIETAISSALMEIFTESQEG